MYTARRDGDIVYLEDLIHQTEVSIATRIGNLAYRMRVHGHDTLYFPFSSTDDYAVNPHGWYGVSLLAPWASRLDEEAFHANGRRYPFDMALGNVTPVVPLHGFLSYASGWDVIGFGGGDRGAWVTSRLDVFRRPDWMKQWPLAHTIEITHRLLGGVLEVATTLINHAVEPMPVAIGYHPWFQLTDSARQAWTIAVPARTRWLLSDQLLPTGQTQSTSEFFPGETISLDDYDLDDVFSDLDRDDRGCATVSVKGPTQQIDVVFGPNYRSLVIYAPHPGDRGSGRRIRPGASPLAKPGSLETTDFICLEPMAAITNALNLAPRGVYHELQSVAPGGAWQESFWIRPVGFAPG